jgi:ATP-binding cassette, subfamily B, bacterial
MFVIRKMLSQLLGRRFHQRVPIVQQFSNNECGLACLVMILNYYGKHISLSECRQECAIGRDGTTAETLARVAHSYGLRVKAFSVQNLDALKSIPYPAIAHWDFNHFVVVERWSPKNRVEVIDPALGRRYLTHDEFNKGFTGVVLVMEPGVQFDRQLITKSVYANWRIYIHHILSIPGLLSFFTQILIASLVLQMLGLTLPLLTKILIDQVLPLGDISVMTIIGIGIVILILTQPVAGYIRAILLIYLQTRLDSRIMLGFFEHLLGLPYQFFQHRSSGDLLLRLGSNALVREMLTGRTISVIFDGFLVFGYLFVLMALSPRFGTLVFFIGAIQVVILMVTTRSVHRLLQKDLATQAESQSYLVEALKGILTLKSSGAEPQALNHWSSLFYKQLNVSIQRNHLSAIIEITMGTVRTFSPIILLWAGAYYVLNGTMTLGTMLANSTCIASVNRAIITAN